MLSPLERELLTCLRGLVIIAEHSLSSMDDEQSCAEIPREQMAAAKKLVNKIDRRIAKAEALAKTQEESQGRSTFTVALDGAETP